MKTTRIILLLLVFSATFSKARTLNPPATYTLVFPCTPFVVISAIPNTYGCYSFSVTNAGASDPNGYYTWNFGDGSGATGDFVYHCYSPGTVTIVYTITVAYNSAALCGPLPTVNAYTLALSPPPQSLCVGYTPGVSLVAKTATVWAGSAIPETVFLYDYGDGTAPTGSTNVHTYANCGNYIITVKSWDMNQPQYVCFSYAAINIACPTGTLTEIKGQENKPITRIFPNPCLENVNIRSEKIINGIKIVEITGREIYSSYVNDSQCAIPVSGFPSGTYFLKCIYEDGSETNTRLIKD